MGGVLLERLGNLQGQFAGRREDQRLRRLLLQVQSAENRKCEGGRLAGTRLGQAHHIAARQQRGNGLGLDRGGTLISEVAQRLGEPLPQPEFGEGMPVIRLVVSHLVIGRFLANLVFDHPMTLVGVSEQVTSGLRAVACGLSPVGLLEGGRPAMPHLDDDPRREQDEEDDVQPPRLVGGREVLRQRRGRRQFRHQQ